MKKKVLQKNEAKYYLIEKFQNCLDSKDTAEEAEKYSRELFNPSKCLLCRKNFAIVQNLPRILVQCGHSLCSECILKNWQNDVVNCPFCNLKVKNVKTIDFLPVNQQIFFELQRQQIQGKKKSQQNLDLSEKFLDSNFQNIVVPCKIHPKQRLSHICTMHQEVLCIQCVKIHRNSECKISNFLNTSYQLKFKQLNQIMIIKQ